jgi:MFS family permease
MGIRMEYAQTLTGTAESNISMPRVVAVSSLGTIFEWYDFYLVGSLASYINKAFFSGVDPTLGFIFTLLGFAVGFIVRPIGALIFGSIGDKVGRKTTFVLTMILMGTATVLIGLIPTYAQIGVWAPLGFVGMRCIQGLAMGGEYGGAVTYVAEHAPINRRGLWTSCIQATALLAVVAGLLVIVITRGLLGEGAFAAWGWRIPFLLSLILLLISIWIRMNLHESPVFAKLIAKGATSKAPIREAFGSARYIKLFLVALVLVAGQAVVGYTGMFYVLFFLTQTLHVDPSTANIMTMTALLISVPAFAGVGALSDIIGRKPLIVGGCLLASLTVFPLFHALTYYVNPDLTRAQEASPVVVIADPEQCSLQFNPIGTSQFVRSCDIAKRGLAVRGISYQNAAAAPGQMASIRIGSIVVPAFDGGDADAVAAQAAFKARLDAALRQAGYPDSAASDKINYPMAMLILLLLMLYVAMAYGPIGAMLVEMYPTRIRYTAMSLPAHVGSGWFGGLLPATAFAIVTAHGDMYSGLWYPAIISGLAGIAGLFLVRDRKNNDLASME